jgi:hypothetical protein
MPPTVLEYVREDGTNAYKVWFDDLPAQAAAKVSIAPRRAVKIAHLGALQNRTPPGGQFKIAHLM